MYPVVKIEQPARAVLHLAIVEPIEVGRECDGLVVLDSEVSRRHVRLSPSGRSVLVTDLGSTNGSFVDGERVHDTTTLMAGMLLTIGNTRISVDQPRESARTEESSHPGSATIVATLEPHGDSSATTSIDRMMASFGRTVELPSGGSDETITIVFSDIEGSTDLAVRLGDSRWVEALTWHNSVVEQRVRANGGRIVKSQGDGFMVTFTSARRAIIAACEMQREFQRKESEQPNDAIRVRVGMHTGEPIRQDSGDILGRQVILAARIADNAAGNEIVVSAVVRELASARGDLTFGDPRTVDLKGLGTHEVYPVQWDLDLDG